MAVWGRLVLLCPSKLTVTSQTWPGLSDCFPGRKAVLTTAQLILTLPVIPAPPPPPPLATVFCSPEICFLWASWDKYHHLLWPSHLHGHHYSLRKSPTCGSSVLWRVVPARPVTGPTVAWIASDLLHQRATTIPSPTRSGSQTGEGFPPSKLFLSLVLSPSLRTPWSSLFISRITHLW